VAKVFPKQILEIRNADGRGNVRPGSDFKLIGSGYIPEGVTDPLADIRAEQWALSEKKLDSFGK
jgi:hypothetical protein